MSRPCSRTWLAAGTFSVLIALTSVSDGLSATFQVPSEYATIQDAIDAAASLDTISVAPGTYTGVGNREIQFFGKDVRVIGAGPGSTILDCEGAGRGFDIRGGESNAALIEGLTIFDGAALAVTWPGAFAAGISCRGLSHPTIRDVVIEGCNARQGGALGCADSSPIVEDCVFRNNTALNIGGGASLLNFSDPIFDRCLITGNSARNGGGVQVDLSEPIFRSTTIASNAATEAGGGAAIQRSVETVFERVLFSANCAVTGTDLAVTDVAGAATIDCCALTAAGLDAGPGTVTETGGRVLGNPRLCEPAPCSNAPHADGSYGLAADSPCLPSASPCGLLIGALGEECAEPSGIGDDGDWPSPPVQNVSWGELKGMMR
ncbi:MAG: right-handed parallel beta-helix repeat-containing protein [Candidatus Eisenbacteria bacterium]|uniref:Right-handed parallel beta-helix repeat-containing protein n=1 Tax=Eiseniibacteriota bacterium TaxID=2212470 RepID=A0A956NGZ0_UNCEI|nr:right-handed parallel beta-helix repeat-containing protein [Candidatus Eisenbacteria bacterium]